MKVNFLGDGLSIVVSCSYLSHHDWMSYLAWFSITKNLPDAKVYLCVQRTDYNRQLFNWTRLCKVQVFYFSQNEKVATCIVANDIKSPILVIPAESVCLRDFNEANYDCSSLKDITMLDASLSCDIKNNNHSVFVTYINGWGKFVTSRWINKLSSPLFSQNIYGSSEMSINEIRMNHLWSAATPLFQTISRS